MADYTHLYNHYMIVDIEKPLYEHNNISTVRVSLDIVKQAIHNFVKLVVRTPKGEKEFWPKEVKKSGKKVKEIFLRPEEPMVLVELDIPYSKKEPIEKWQFS